MTNIHWLSPEHFPVLWNLHLFATFSMTGIIWLVQLLVYPQFKNIPFSNLKSYHLLHTQKITFVVAPLMLIELATGILLVLMKGAEEIFLVNLFLILGLWLATAFVSVPIHQKMEVELEKPEDSQKAQVLSKLVLKLIRTNYLRTVLWSVRSGLLLIWLLYLQSPAA